MKWVVLTSCFFPNERPLKMLTKSMEILGFRHMLRTYGKGELYENWTRMKVHRMIPKLEKFKAEGITHFLYTDGRDAFFLRDWNIIQAAWESMGSPEMLLSGQPEAFPIKALSVNYTSKNRYRYHCCGGYMGSVEAWLETHKRFVKDDYESRPTGGDEAGVWQWAWNDGWFRPMIDEQCEIFQNLGGSGQDVKLSSFSFPPVYNESTQNFPCLLHFTGFSKNAEYGVYDDMKLWWDAVFPDHPVEREEVKP